MALSSTRTDEPSVMPYERFAQRVAEGRLNFRSSRFLPVNKSVLVFFRQYVSGFESAQSSILNIRIRPAGHGCGGRRSCRRANSVRRKESTPNWAQALLPRKLSCGAVKNCGCSHTLSAWGMNELYLDQSFVGGSIPGGMYPADRAVRGRSYPSPSRAIVARAGPIRTRRTSFCSAILAPASANVEAVADRA
jgi:hypothetical protein